MVNKSLSSSTENSTMSAIKTGLFVLLIIIAIFFFGYLVTVAGKLSYQHLKKGDYMLAKRHITIANPVLPDGQLADISNCHLSTQSTIYRFDGAIDDANAAIQYRASYQSDSTPQRGCPEIFFFSTPLKKVNWNFKPATKLTESQLEALVFYVKNREVH